MIANWISETTATVGTGVISLGGASSPDMATFSSQVPTGSVLTVSIKDGNNREVCDVTATTGAPWTLTRIKTRETLTAGAFSAANTPLSLSGAAVVSLTALAETAPAFISAQAGILFQQGPSINNATGTPGGAAILAGQLMFLEQLTYFTKKINAIFVNITVAGAAGALVRIGIYASDPVTGFPTTLLVDSLDIIATAVGMVGNTLATPLILPPGLYYIANMSNDATVTADGCLIATGTFGANTQIGCTSAGFGAPQQLTLAQAYGVMPATVALTSADAIAASASIGAYFQ